jgi:hypothetical protein
MALYSTTKLAQLRATTWCMSLLYVLYLIGYLKNNLFSTSLILELFHNTCFAIAKLMFLDTNEIDLWH